MITKKTNTDGMHGYDGRYRLTSANSYASDNDEFGDWSYGYDLADNMTSKTEPFQKAEGGMMKDESLRHRTKALALRVIRLYGALPKTTEAGVLGKQLLRSGTSVGAHYREASRARSHAEFVSKIEGGLQELEESVYWMELLVEADILPHKRLADLLEEADELTAILVTCVKNTKARSGALK